MNADIEGLIALQKLDSKALDAARTLASEPERLQALEATLAAARQQVAVAKEHLVQNQAARRELEKNIAVHQGRLSKFRDQAMAVKTNQEYHAVQHEISFAQNEIKTIEDKELELMMEADELSAAVKRAEASLASEAKAAEADKRALTAEQLEMKALVAQLAADRASMVGALEPAVLAVFELVASRRNGVGMAEAKEGVCTICHVRLRPQVFNTVLRNDQLLQCDSCQRILFSVPLLAPQSTPSAS